MSNFTLNKVGDLFSKLKTQACLVRSSRDRMVFYCFPRIQTRCQQLLTRLNIYNGGADTCSDVTLILPDDVLIDILIRFQVDQVLACRRVCVRWDVLTSSHEFLEAYLKTLTPTIYLHSLCLNDKNFEVDLYTIDYTGNDFVVEKIHSDSVRYEKKASLLYCSCDGLLLFRKDHSFLAQYAVRNFFSSKVIHGMETTKSTYPIGIFFNHSMKKYNSLHVTFSGNRYLYEIFTGEEAQFWQELGFFPYVPGRENGPTAINGILYWMVYSKGGYENEDNRLLDPPCSESIMFFDTYKEKFGVRPHPKPYCSQKILADSSLHKHGHMHLLEMEGSLALSSICKGVMHVWHLDDVRGWTWVKKWEVDLDWGLKRNPFHRNPSTKSRYQIIPMSIKSNELLIWWTHIGLHHYNLQLNTVRRIAGIDSNAFHGHISYTKSVKSIAPLPTDI